MDAFGSGEWTSPDDIRQTVQSLSPHDDREVAAEERFLLELDRLRRPCDRDADPVHVTASGVVAGVRGTVLHLHRRLGRWMQPGGHIEFGESPAQAARRESEEETGMALAHPRSGPRLFHLDVHDAALGHTHLDLRYLLIGADADPSPPREESPAVRWYSWEDAALLADEALAGALVEARRIWDQEGLAKEVTSAGPGTKVREAASG